MAPPNKTPPKSSPLPPGGVPSARRPQVFYPNLEKPKQRPPPPPPPTAKRAPAAAARAPPPPPPPPTPAAAKRSRVPLYVGGVALYGVLVYGAYVYMTSKPRDDAPIKPIPLEEQQDISGVYNKIAKTYDSEIGTSEFFMGMPLLRRAMAKRATGDVLESAAGTGRNLKYYKLKNINSITFVDTSSPMLQIARRAFRKKYPKFENVEFVRQDAAKEMRTASGERFDTVVQSMGLCSHHSPIRLLQSLGDACKDDGKIILLEHGRSKYEWLNNILDRHAERHAETWGCWWNRDVEGIVRDSGLRITNIKRYHFGTTYWIEAQPPIRETEKKSEEEKKKA